MVTSSKLVLLASTFYTTTLAHYKLAQDYTGENLFNNFDFYTGPGFTHGHVDFVGDATADAAGLVDLGYYVNATKPSEVVYLGVDSKSVLPLDQGRQSLRLESVQMFNQSLVIADILHQPGNICGVWPAFWMLGSSGTWPASGEIDILEGANQDDYNRMTLHTSAGLNMTGPNNNTTMTGNLTMTNCDVNASNQAQNVGCSVADSPSTYSYGKTFNDNQGGVFAMQYTRDFIKIWFFNRTHIPDDIYAGTPSPPQQNGSDFHAWGLPNALFEVPIPPPLNDISSNSTNQTTPTPLQTHIHDLRLIFETSFCGDWAGRVWNQTSCAQLAPTCEEYVSLHPEAFKDAYWLIKSLQVFTRDEDDDVAAHADDDDSSHGSDNSTNYDGQYSNNSSSNSSPYSNNTNSNKATYNRRDAVRRQAATKVEELIRNGMTNGNADSGRNSASKDQQGKWHKQSDSPDRGAILKREAADKVEELIRKAMKSGKW